MVENGREVIAVSQEVFTGELGDAPIPPKARLDAAEYSGVAAAIALSQRLMTAPRDLKIAPQTPEEDRIAGRPIIFTLGGLDPDWGSGVGVVIDWGDHLVAVAADRFLAAPPGAVPRAVGPGVGTQCRGGVCPSIPCNCGRAPG